MSVLPRAARPFVTFPALLRANGFAVAPEQTTAFLTAIGLLGPKSIGDIRRAAHATLAPPPERRAAFDALFGAHFLGEMELGDQLGEPDDETMRVQEDRDGGMEPLLSDEVNEAGQDATTIEALSVRHFGAESDFEVLRRFARAAPARLPRRPGYRHMRARRFRYASSAPRAITISCAASRARRPRGCRAALASGACAPGAANTSIRNAPCARRCATTAT